MGVTRDALLVRGAVFLRLHTVECRDRRADPVRRCAGHDAGIGSKVGRNAAAHAMAGRPYRARGPGLLGASRPDGTTAVGCRADGNRRRVLGDLYVARARHGEPTRPNDDQFCAGSPSGDHRQYCGGATDSRVAAGSPPRRRLWRTDVRVGYTVWYSALRGLTATRAAVLQLVVPVLAAAGGVVFLMEPISLTIGRIRTPRHRRNRIDTDAAPARCTHLHPSAPSPGTRPLRSRSASADR